MTSSSSAVGEQAQRRDRRAQVVRDRGDEARCAASSWARSRPAIASTSRARSRELVVAAGASSVHVARARADGVEARAHGVDVVEHAVARAAASAADRRRRRQ